MLNLYANETRNGIMKLVGKTEKTNVADINVENRRVLSSFAVLSLLILSVIANGSQVQASFEQQQQATIASFTSTL